MIIFVLPIRLFYKLKKTYEIMAKKEKGCNCENNDRIWIPQNSKIIVNDDKSINIIPPRGYLYVGYDKNGRLQSSSGGTKVSCDCTGSGSCLPFVVSGGGGSTGGCQGRCELCLMETSAQKGDIDIAIDRGGYLDLTQNVEFVTGGLQLPAAFKAMFDLNEVKQEINNFVKEVYQGLPFPKIREGKDFFTVPNGYLMAVVNVFGRATTIPVPTIALQASGGVGGGTASCSCSEGNCSVKSSSIPGVGSATWCEGSCTGTCTLQTSINKGNGLVDITYEAVSYRF